MGKKLLIEIGFMVLSCLVVACGGNAVAPPVRSATTALFVQTQPAHVNSPLVGSFTTTITKQDGLVMVTSPAVTVPGSDGTVAVGSWLIEFGPDGYYTALGDNSNSPFQYVCLGQYTVTGNQLTVSDAKCCEFNGPAARTATYSWTLEGNVLTLKVVGRDLCSARRLLFTSHALKKNAFNTA